MIIAVIKECSKFTVKMYILCFSVRITTSTYPVPCVCNQDQISDWFEGLAECLHWNVRKPQKAFSKTESSTSLVSLNSELNNFDQSDMDY